MTAPSPDKPDKAATEIERGAERMRKTRESPPPSPMSGLGTFGMVGWSIAVPTLGGVFLGLWLDRVAPQAFSWTVALLVVGVTLGAAIAWRWIWRERDPD
jgi:ATP synthase protein I